MLEGGGTLAVYLGIHAMELGYKATVYSYNLRVFDPSWFSFNSEQLIEKLKKQLEYKDGKKFTKTCNAYLEFLEKGGNLRFDNLEPHIIQQYTKAQLPVIAGLSSSYLYPSKREFETRNNKIIYDDVRGEPTGHFVVVKEINDQLDDRARELEKNDQFDSAAICRKNRLSVDNVMSSYQSFVQKNRNDLTKTKIVESYDDFMYTNKSKLESEFYALNDFRTSMRGVKVRGVFSNTKEAEVKAKKLQNKDKYHNENNY